MSKVAESPAGRSRLEWTTIPPWKRIEVFDTAAGFLEHTVSCSIPLQRLPELSSFGWGLNVNARNGEFTARGDSEENNFLCLNLANDIVRGKRTAGEAREFYRDTIRKSMAGKSSIYMERLLFSGTLSNAAEIPQP